MKVLIAADRIVRDPESTPEAIQLAINDVKATGDHAALLALERTIAHEKLHKMHEGDYND